MINRCSGDRRRSQALGFSIGVGVSIGVATDNMALGAALMVGLYMAYWRRYGAD